MLGKEKGTRRSRSFHLLKYVYKQKHPQRAWWETSAHLLDPPVMLSGVE